MRRLIVLGKTIAEACAIVGVSEPTARKYYRQDIDHGLAHANMAVVANLFKAATSSGHDRVRAAELWLQNRAGWRDQRQSGNDGAPVRRQITIRLVRPRPIPQEASEAMQEI